jgi:hypothetical protein
MASPILTHSGLIDFELAGTAFVYTADGVEAVDAATLSDQAVGLAWDPEVGSAVHVPPAFQDKLPRFYSRMFGGSTNASTASMELYTKYLPGTTLANTIRWLTKGDRGFMDAGGVDEFVLPMTVGGAMGGQWDEWDLFEDLQTNIRGPPTGHLLSLQRWSPPVSPGAEWLSPGEHPLLTPLYEDFAQLYVDSESWRAAASCDDEDFELWYVHGSRIQKN